MRQSERMRLRKAYLEHPLRVSYEGERRVLLTSSPILRFYYCVLAVQFILLFVYGICFSERIQYWKLKLLLLYWSLVLLTYY